MAPMNQQQRTRMQRELTRSFLDTLAQNLTSYSNQSIRYLHSPWPAAPGRGNRQRLDRAAGRPADQAGFSFLQEQERLEDIRCHRSR